MTVDLPLRCRCGAIRGVLREVSPDAVNRLVCYCDDCQAFARALHRPDALDAHGGTDISQVRPATVQITAGQEHLAVLRLTGNGMYRWYAACCSTPIANTMPRWIPAFVGLIHTFVDHEADGRSRDEVMGPSRAGCMARFATGDRSTLTAHDKVPVGVLFRIGGLVVTWTLRSDRRISPFFDGEGRARATPRVLSADELQAARS